MNGYSSFRASLFNSKGPAYMEEAVIRDFHHRKALWGDWKG